MSNDWSLPSISDLYVNVLSWLKARDVDATTMGLGNGLPTNAPSGFIAANETNRRLEKFDGVSYAGLFGNAWAIKADSALNADTVTSITSAQVISALGFTPPKVDGTGATGTWSISINEPLRDCRRLQLPNRMEL